MQLDNRIFFEQVEAMLREGREVQIRIRGNSMRPLLRDGKDIAVLRSCRQTGSEGAAEPAGRPKNGQSPETVGCQAANRPGTKPNASQNAKGSFEAPGSLQDEVGNGAVREALQSGTIERDCLQEGTEIDAERETVLYENESGVAQDSSQAETGNGVAQHFLQAENGNNTAQDHLQAETGNSTAQDHMQAENISGRDSDSGHTSSGNAVSTDTLRPGDVILFRHGGRYILHRIVRIDTLIPENGAAAPHLRYTLCGDGNYRTREYCSQADIRAVLACVIRPSGRIVACRSRRWRWQSRLWLALPPLVRRYALAVPLKIACFWSEIMRERSAFRKF